VQSVVPDTQFGVVQFKDDVDSPEYQVVQGMTANAAPIQAAINGLSAGGGGDDPEAHNLVFHNSYNPALGGDTGWRAGTRKFVVVISDAQPHGAGTAGIPGCTDASADPHGLNTATELAGMKAAQRTLLLIRQVSNFTSTSLSCYQGLAAGGFDGGSAVDGGGSLATQIVSLIQAAFANVANVHLEVSSASPAPADASWISFSPASVGPVPAPSTQTFTLTAAVPAGTPAGDYTFDIVAKADGVDIGHQTLTVHVNRPPVCTNATGDPASLWPPNHKLRLVSVGGVTDPDGDAVTVTITGVTQDEPLNASGDGNTVPDAVAAAASNEVQLRAERAGTGDGRVYRIAFTAADTRGGTCTGAVAVTVPHDQSGTPAVDSGQTVNSFGP